MPSPEEKGGFGSGFHWKNKLLLLNCARLTLLLRKMYICTYIVREEVVVQGKEARIPPSPLSSPLSNVSSSDWIPSLVSMLMGIKSVGNAGLVDLRCSALPCIALPSSFSLSVAFPPVENGKKGNMPPPRHPISSFCFLLLLSKKKKKKTSQSKVPNFKKIKSTALDNVEYYSPSPHIESYFQLHDLILT